MVTEKNTHPRTPSRREFVQAGVGLSAAGLAAMARVNNVFAADTQSAPKSDKALIKPGETILFQGILVGENWVFQRRFGFQNVVAHQDYQL